MWLEPVHKVLVHGSVKFGVNDLFSSLRTALSEGLQGGVGQPKVVKGSPLIGPRTRDIYRDVGREARHGFRPYVSSCSLQEGSGDIQVTSEEAREGHTMGLGDTSKSCQPCWRKVKEG